MIFFFPQEILKVENQECNFTNDAKLVISISFTNKSANNQHEEDEEKDSS